MAQERQDLGLTLSAVGVIVAAIVGQYFVTSQGDAPRHREPFTLQRTATGDERVPARLWQDPLAAVHRYVEVLQERKQVSRRERPLKSEWTRTTYNPYRWILYRESTGRLVRGAFVEEGWDGEGWNSARVAEEPASIVQRGHVDTTGSGTQRAPKLMVLGVMVDGRATAEAGERRRRQRHAIVSALGVEGFVPVSPEHIGLIEVIKRAQYEEVGEDEPGQLGPLVPFEWMRFDGILGRGKVGAARRSELPDRVLICWFDETHFGVGAPDDEEDDDGAGDESADVDRDKARVSEAVPRVTDLVEALLRDAIAARRAEDPDSDTASLLAEIAALRLIGPAQSESLVPLLHRLTARPPDAAEDSSDEPTPLHAATLSFLGALDRYLDTGVPALSGGSLATVDKAVRDFVAEYPNAPEVPPEFEALRTRIIEVVRADAILADIEDSDATWQTTAGRIAVDALVGRGPGWGLPIDGVGGDVGGGAGDRAACVVPATREVDRSTASDVMTRAITNYLDDPLTDEQSGALRRVLTSLEGLEAALERVRARASARSALATALCAALGDRIRDSDPAWAASVVGTWDGTDRWFEGFGGMGELSRESFEPQAPAHDAHLRAAIESQLQIFSPRATLSLALTARRPDVGRWIEDHPKEVGAWREEHDASAVGLLYRQEERPCIVSTVAEDHHLALALVDELALRGVSLAFDDEPGGDHVVLLSEWDTIYGRALPVVFEAAARFRASVPVTPDPCTPPSFARAWDRDLDEFLDATDAAHVSRDDRWLDEGDPGPSGPIHRFRYLRGLDGDLPDIPDAIVPRADSSTAGADSNAASGAGSTRTHAALDVDRFLDEPGFAEHAVGRSQQDQLLRMARKLSVLDEELRRKGGRLGAVGVLGSDVYDKLVIIRALRDRFPGAIFFTTGADARFLHREHYEANRNLLIASSYGLWLADALQGATPPFRDGYQASDFLACLLALSTGDRRTELKARMREAISRPRLFEVGRDGLIDLSPPDAEAGVHPEPERRLPFEGVVGRVITVVVTWLLFLAAAWSGLRDWVRRRPRRALGFGALWVVSLAVLLVLMRTSVGSADGEPFRIAAGVSVWPGEVLRLAAALLGVTFMVRIGQILNEGNARLAHEFRLDPRGPSTSDGERCALEVEAIWPRFTAALRARRRWLSVCVSSVLFCCGTRALMWWLGFPWTPARGLLARRIDWFLDWGGLLALAMLTLSVVHVTRHGAAFVAEVSRAGVRWRTRPADHAAASGSAARLDASVREFGLPPRWLDEHTTLALVEQHTRMVGSLLHYPFWIGLLLILARHRAFDAWETSPAFTLALCAMAGIALYAGVHLLRTARDARTRLVGRMQQHLFHPELPRKSESRRRFKLLLHETLAARGGAFVGWASNPVIQAILIPSSGLSLVTLLETMLAGTRG